MEYDFGIRHRFDLRRSENCQYQFVSLGTASTARALSAYFDSLVNFAMKNYFTEHFPMHSGIFSAYADLFAMALCLVMTGKEISVGLIFALENFALTSFFSFCAQLF